MMDILARGTICTVVMWSFLFVYMYIDVCVCVTSDWQSHAEVHITQVSLAALDNLVRWGWGFAGQATLLVHSEAALLMHQHSVSHSQRRETLLSLTPLTHHTRTTLTHALVLFLFRLRVCLGGGPEKERVCGLAKNAIEFQFKYITPQCCYTLDSDRLEAVDSFSITVWPLKDM